MIIVTDITILFSDLVSLIVPLQTWNVKYYKYANIKNGLKSLIIGQYKPGSPREIVDLIMERTHQITLTRGTPHHLQPLQSDVTFAIKLVI